MKDARFSLYRHLARPNGRKHRFHYHQKSTLKNLDSLRLALSPKQVQVKFAAPLAELRTINASSLTAEATYLPNASGVLTIRITGLPPTAKQLIVTPSAVNYLIVE